MQGVKGRPSVREMQRTGMTLTCERRSKRRSRAASCSACTQPTTHFKGMLDALGHSACILQLHRVTSPDGIPNGKRPAVLHTDDHAAFQAGS